MSVKNDSREQQGAAVNDEQGSEGPASGGLCGSFSDSGPGFGEWRPLGFLPEAYSVHHLFSKKQGIVPGTVSTPKNSC